MSEPRVTMEHARAAKLVGTGVLCAPGIRVWCARHNIDLRDFAEHGLPLSTLERIDDAFAQRVVAIVRASEEASHG